MGNCCTEQVVSRRGATQDEIIMLLRKIRVTWEHQLNRRQKEFFQQQRLLLDSFKKPPTMRSFNAEKGLINRALYFKNITNIYVICEFEVKIILDYKSSLENNFQLVLPSLQTLVFSASILEEPLLFQLEAKLKKKCPQFRQPTEKDIRHQMIKMYKKGDEAPFQMQNDYVLDFSNRYGVELNKICEVGHRYCYGGVRQ